VTPQIAPILGILYALSEAALLWLKRSGKAPADADRGSLALIWIVVLASVCAAFALAHALPQLAFGPAGICRAAGAALFAAGIIVRWYAILALGRFFTVNVAIASDHRLVEAGPYRLLRHPSYTGALLAFLGLGVCLDNWASLALLMVPTAVVFLRRMRIEEDALLETFGERYRDYMRRTRRLIPFIY
jgi:protein-S-isoprenylcysteine O-methyltransferase Ste14